MPSTNSRTYDGVTPRRVAFLGLGVMGLPMAGHLALAGHQVTVYNRSPAKSQAWGAEFKGASAPTPREAAAGCDIVFCCVGNDDDLRAVVLGRDGALAGMKPGAIFVDHTTASADVARELCAAAQALGVAFVDAPVSGGQAGAQNGLLTVMCGGDATAFETMRPVAMAKADGGIQVIAFQIAESQARTQFQMDVRKLMAPIGQAWQQPMHHPRGQHRQHQGALRRFVADLRAGRGQFFEQWPHLIGVAAARLGQSHAAPLADQQGLAQHVFDGAYLMAHRAMGQMQRLGGFAQTAQSRHSDECTQGGQRWNAFDHVRKIHMGCESNNDVCA